MTTPVNNESELTRSTSDATVLLVDSRARQPAFEKALGSVPDIEIISARRSGSQTVFNIRVSNQNSAQLLNFLRDTVRSLPGFDVRIQGATLGPVPSVICTAVVALKPAVSRSRLQRRRVIAPQPVESPDSTTAIRSPGLPVSTRPTGSTEIPGIRSSATSVFDNERNDSSSETQLVSVIDFANVWKVIRNAVFVVLFLFGDVELALAKWYRSRNKPKKTNGFNLKNSVVTGGRNTLLGTGFIFGDIELAYRKLRTFRPGISKRYITDVTMFLGVASLLIRALVETIFGEEKSETKQTGNGSEN